MNGWMNALLASSPQLVTRTFTSNQSFTVPYGVSNLVSVSGKGSDGAAAVFATQTLDLFSCSLGGSGGSPVSTASANSFGVTQASALDGSGVRTVSYTYRNYQIDASDLTVYFDYPRSVTISGAGSSDFGQTSGNLTQANYSSNFARYTASVQQSPATNGQDASGFGQTFPGGMAGPANTVSLSNVAVTQGQSYSIVVPSGGSITITYYQ